VQEGVVKWFNSAKGWGIIESDGESFFVHHQSITDERFYKNGRERFRSLRPNAAVTFSVAETTKSMRRALDVKLVTQTSGMR